MIENKLKYMGTTLNFKQVEIPNQTDDYGRPKVIRVAKQSDAEKVTDEETGIIRWTGGDFFDMKIDAYITDEEYEDLDDEKLIEICKKNKL